MFIHTQYTRDKEKGLHHVLVNLQTGERIDNVVVANDEVGFYVTTEGHVYHGQPIKLMTREEYMQRSTNSSNSPMPDSSFTPTQDGRPDVPMPDDARSGLSHRPPGYIRPGIEVLPSFINPNAVVRGRRV